MNTVKKLTARMKRAPRAQGDDHAPSLAHDAADQDDALLGYLSDNDEDVNEVVHEHLGNHGDEEEDEPYDGNMANDAYRERDKGESDDDEDDEDENHYDDGGGGGGDSGEDGHEEEDNDDEDRAGGGSEDESPEEEDLEEEGLEEGLSGQRAVDKAIDLMRNGVKAIDLTERSIGDEGTMALGEELGTNTSLVSLNLEKNGIHGEGGAALAEALHQNCSLTTLSLKCNSIGIDGAVSFAHALSVNITLCSLNLGSEWDEERNNIGDDGVLALVDALGENTVLTSLDLSFNGISEVGGEAIAALLSTNTSLQILSLESNNVGPDGAVGLGEGLSNNRSLTSLNLKSNFIGPDGAVGLGEGLGKNISLTELNLSENYIGVAGQMKIAEVLLTGNCSLRRIIGLPDLPTSSWTELLQVSKIDARIVRIREYLLDKDEEKWTWAAHKLAGNLAHILAVFLIVLTQYDSKAQETQETHRRLRKLEFWLLKREGEKEKKNPLQDEDSDLPLIHALFDCHATRTQYSLPERFCVEVFMKCLPLKDGLSLMKAEDGGGRTVRSLALIPRHIGKIATNEKEDLRLKVVGKQSSKAVKNFGLKLGRQRVSLRSEKPHVVVVVLEKDCWDDVQKLWEGQPQKGRDAAEEMGAPLLAVAVCGTDDEWDFEDMDKFKNPALRSELFDRLEVLMWRDAPGAKTRDPEKYIVEHEEPALIMELCSRAKMLQRSPHNI